MVTGKKKNNKFMFNIICLRSYIKHSIHGVPPQCETVLCSSEIIRYDSLPCYAYDKTLCRVFERKLGERFKEISQENTCLCSFNKQQGPLHSI